MSRQTARIKEENGHPNFEYGRTVGWTNIGLEYNGALAGWLSQLMPMQHASSIRKGFSWTEMAPRIHYFSQGFACTWLSKHLLLLYFTVPSLCAAAAYYDGARYALLISPSSWNHAYTVIGPSSMQLSPMKTLVIITFLSTCRHVLCNMHWVGFFFFFAFSC